MTRERKRLRHLAGDFRIEEAGAGMVEFAIAAAVFIMLLLGIFEFGLTSWAKNAVASAAREGTRFASVRGGDSGQTATVNAVRDYVRSKSALSPITVNTTWENIAKSTNSKVTVTVSYDYRRVGLIIPNKTLTGSSTMRIVF